MSIAYNQKNSKIRVRVFYNTGCKRCELYIPLLKATGFDLELVDVDLDENQAICDKHDVDEVPHTQLLSKNGDILVKCLHGIISPEYLKQLFCVTG